MYLLSLEPFKLETSSGDNDTNFEEQEEGVDSTCSSPEQETVRPKESSLTCTRGPHVQDLFTRGTDVGAVPIFEHVPSPLKDEASSLLRVEVPVIESETPQTNLEDAKGSSS